MFLHDTFYELSDELAVFPSEHEAEQAYYESFGGRDEADSFPEADDADDADSASFLEYDEP
ncbi:Transcriptional regulator protein (SplA) [compost metagenome]